MPSWIREHLRQFRYGAWILEGVEKHSKADLRIFFYGASEVHKNYIADMAFESLPCEKYLGRFWLFKPLRFKPVKTSDCYLTISEIDKKYIATAKQTMFYVPCWLSGKIDIAKSLQIIKSTRSLKAEMNRIRKNKLSYEVVHSKEEYVDFYNNMYLPYLKSTYGNLATLHSLDSLLKRFDRSELLLVKIGDKAVAGDVIEYKSDGPKPFCLGVLNGRREYVSSGALQACYYYRMIYLQSKGHQEIDLGGTRAFFSDGVLRYKKKWGFIPTFMHGDKGFLIRHVSLTAGTRSFLRHNPFIICDQDGFSSVCFVDGDTRLTQKEQKKILNECVMPGIKRVMVYQMGAKDSPLDISVDVSTPVDIRQIT